MQAVLCFGCLSDAAALCEGDSVYNLSVVILVINTFMNAMVHETT